MKKYFLMVVAICSSVAVYAQQKPLPHINQFVDFTATVGSSEGALAASYVRNWRLGKRKKIEIGLGARATVYSGSKKEFYTAPARLSRSTTVPFIIVFAAHEDQNTDTLTVDKAFTTSLNISANFGYHISSKWYAGFNIDFIGLTAGKKSSVALLSNGVISTEPAAKPANFNVLLTGDNDYGNLNSEFFVKYKIAKRCNLKALYQFYFSEYKTQNIKQIAPDGTAVHRFRNKVNAFGLGISYDL